MKRLVWAWILCASLSPPVFAQVTGTIPTSPGTGCVNISVGEGVATIGIQVTGTWTGTLQPQISVQGQAAANTQVTPSTSSVAQSTITGNGAFTAGVAGYSTFLLCGNTVNSGTANVFLNATKAARASAGGGGGGSVSAGTTGQYAFYAANGTTISGGGPITTNALSKGDATNALASSLASDNGTTLSYTGSGGASATAGPLNSGTNGGTGGSLTLKGSTSGTATISPNSTASVVTSGQPQLNIGTAGGGNGVLGLNGTTSGTATLTAPSVAGTISNAATLSNSLNVSGPQVTVSAAGNGAGTLALSGNTSGTATLAAPAVAGTNTNPIVISNAIQIPATAGTAPGIANGSVTNSGIGYGSSNQINFFTTGNVNWSWTGSGQGMGSGAFLAFSSATTGTGSFDTGISRKAVGVLGVGNGTAGDITGFLQSGMTKFVTSNFTTAANTNLQTITGLSWTVPATALNWTFHCDLSYSQATATAAVAFGIQAATNNPTNIFATGIQYTAAGTSTTGTLATLTTTTATNIVSGTPGATGTNNTVHLGGTLELGASANTINIMVSTATSGDAVTVLRGSYCSLHP